jgi:tRNA-specific 2-thiouridylase
MKERALVAMSGGVDSSVAALLTKEQGFETAGATLKLYENETVGSGREKTCCSLSDVLDARQASRVIGIPFYVFNFTREFETDVIERFARGYENGLTPNPCVACNRFIKFEKMLQKAEALSFSRLVTGHYARVALDAPSGRRLLKKGLDETKDQSYVLCLMTQAQLAKTLFPLGEYKKSEIRRIAEENGFMNAKKRDSQDICFVPDGDYARFLAEYRGEPFAAGSFTDENGNVIGSHNGAVRYTIGQRKGLGMGFGKPMYVLGKNMRTNEVVLGGENRLFSRAFYVGDVNFIACGKFEKPIRVKVKTRYRQKEQWAAAAQVDENRLHIVFDEPQRAVTPGQIAALYDGDVVVAGGIIE